MIQRYDVIFFYFYISKNNNTKNIFSKKDEETKKIDLKIYDLISNFNYKKIVPILKHSIFFFY